MSGDCLIVEVGVLVDPIGWVDPIFTVACGSGLAPPCCKGVVALPTGPGPPAAGALANGIVLAPIGEALAADAVLTGAVGPSGSVLLKGMVLAPATGGLAARAPVGAGGVAVGAGGGVGAPPGAGGAETAEGGGGGPPVPVGAGAMGEGDGGAGVLGSVGPVGAAVTCAEAIGAVDASPGIGAVEAS